jgi:hypothetical protein
MRLAGGAKGPDFWCAFEDGEVVVIGDEPANTIISDLSPLSEQHWTSGRTRGQFAIAKPIMSRRQTLALRDLALMLVKATVSSNDTVRPASVALPVPLFGFCLCSARIPGEHRRPIMLRDQPALRPAIPALAVRSSAVW